MESTKGIKTRNGLKTDVGKEQVVIGFGAQIIAFESKMHPVPRENEEHYKTSQIVPLFSASKNY